MAKRSTPKPQGPLLFTPSEPRGPLYSLQDHVVLSASLPRLVLNPSTHPPLQPHFRLLLQSVTPAGITTLLQLYWAAIVSPGRRGPMA